MTQNSQKGRARQESFDQALRQSAEKPPTTSSQEAARRLREALPPRVQAASKSRMPPVRRWLLVAAASLLLVLLASRWVLVEGPEPGQGAQEAQVASSEGFDQVIPPQGDDIVLLWLDSKTPLYLSVAPPAGAQGE